MTSEPKKASPKSRRVPYFNRELSWLAFNRRVLEQAQNPAYPLLERVKFLAFVSSNLDEFFEIRVAGLQQQIESGHLETGLDGLGPREQLRRIHFIANRLVTDQYATWKESLVPSLAAEGLHFKSIDQLTRSERSWLKDYFEEQVFPVLTPLAIDPAHPFPQLANKALNILVWLDNPATPQTERMMAIIPVPRILPRVVEIKTTRSAKARRQVFVFLSDVVRMFAQRLFPGYHIRSSNPIRVTRNSDLYFDEEEVENLLRTIEEELHKLRRGDAVRLEVRDTIDPVLMAKLLEAVHLSPENVFQMDGPLNMVRLMSVYDMIDRPDLKFPALQPYLPPALHPTSNLFQTIARGDVLLHHPFESFQPVVEFLRQAAQDPAVFAIKQTLYRTSGDSPIVNALVEASANGKQVTVLVEVKARFDEANNIQWARRLEEAGVHVVYGLVGLKTHCKTCLVIRREEGGLRRYAHLGTGNYNPKTARLYTDLSLLTAHPEITAEVAGLFNVLTGFSREPVFSKLLVAPFNLHSSMQKLILREAAHARAGRPARIIIKCNSLIDQESIDNLYKASAAGVQVDLMVRGICGLVPGVKGLSENIRVRSILGRFLEHSRLYYFQNGHDRPVVLSGSADMMPRNFFRRIETIFPIEDDALRDRLFHLLSTYLKDNQFTKFLRANGAYTALPRADNEEPFSVQDFFLAEAEQARRALEARRRQETLDAASLQVLSGPTSLAVSAPPPEDLEHMTPAPEL